VEEIAMAQFAQGYALLIGVGSDLPTTIDDAVGLGTILYDSGRCAYPADQVHLLTGAAATRANILERLAQLTQTSHQEATVLVYFSGHGYEVTASTGKSYYLMPHGYDVNRLYETAVSGRELADALLAIPHRTMALLLDCCHAGGLDNVKAPGFTLTKSPLPSDAQTLLAQGRGRVVIASSRADELSFAGKPYSAFTLALIEALSGEGASQLDGYARVADLALHAREKVPQRTYDRQHPILNFEQADNFVIAYYAGGDTIPKGAPFTGEPVIEAEPGTLRATYQAEAHDRSTVVQGSGNLTATGGSVVVGGDVEGGVTLGRSD
jgi:hypothetical protein